MPIQPAIDYETFLADPSIDRQEKLTFLLKNRPRLLTPGLVGRILDTFAPSPEVAALFGQWLSDNLENVLPAFLGHAAALGPWWTPEHLIPLEPYLNNSKLDTVLSLEARNLLQYTNWGKKKGAFDTDRLMHEMVYSKESSGALHDQLLTMALAEPWIAQLVEVRDLEVILASPQNHASWHWAQALYTRSGAIAPEGDVSIDMTRLRHYIRNLLPVNQRVREIGVSALPILMESLGKTGLRVFVENAVADTDAASPRARTHDIPHLMTWFLSPESPLHGFGPDWVRQQQLRLGHFLAATQRETLSRVSQRMWHLHDEVAPMTTIPLASSVVDGWLDSPDGEVRTMAFLHSDSMEIVEAEEELLLDKRIAASEATSAFGAQPDSSVPASCRTAV